jgi:hypothetical protein
MLAPLVARGGGDICIEVSSYPPVRVFGEWMRMLADWLPTLHEAGGPLSFRCISTIPKR